MVRIPQVARKGSSRRGEQRARDRRMTPPGEREGDERLEHEPHGPAAAEPPAGAGRPTGPGGRASAPPSADVSLDVGQQRQLARPLDRGRELSLVPRAHARQPARQNLAALRQEPPQRAVVFVVEHPHAGFAHGTRFGGPSHASSSSISSTTSAAMTAGAASGLAGRPSDTTIRNRNTLSSSFTARSYSGSSAPAVSYCATT